MVTGDEEKVGRWEVERSGNTDVAGGAEREGDVASDNVEEGIGTVTMTVVVELLVMVAVPPFSVAEDLSCSVVAVVVEELRTGGSGSEVGSGLGGTFLLLDCGEPMDESSTSSLSSHSESERDWGYHSR